MDMIRHPRRSIFVTVGTTLFDPLVETVSSFDFLNSICEQSFTDITVQYGKGQFRPFVNLDGKDNDGGGVDDEIDRLVKVSSTLPSTAQSESTDDIRAMRCRAYRFKPSLASDMESADLILSHAGAGSIMEGLSLCARDGAKPCGKKKLVVVINSRLMHNHQHELAGALEERGYLYVVPDPHLLLDKATLTKIEEFVPLPFPGGDDREFAHLLDEHMGF